MSRARSVRFKKRQKKSGPMEIDITSLLDILVILLIFLIKSYNSSGVTLNVPKGIELPKSESQSINNPGVIIQVSKDKIYVDSKPVLETENLPNIVYDQGRRRIVPLFNELVKKKEDIKSLHIQTGEKAKKFSGLVNLVIDKSLKYSYVKKVLYTCASAGFKQYKFVVLGEEQ